MELLWQSLARFTVFVGLLTGPFWYASIGAARGNQLPHYELALNEDRQLCPKALALYNEMLAGSLRARIRTPSHCTEYADSQAPRFARIGLTVPARLEGPLYADPPEYYFYSVVLGPSQQPRTLALHDDYIGIHGFFRLTDVAILKAGVGPTLSDDLGRIFDPPARGDIDQLISTNELARQQEGAAGHGAGACLLTKWPGFAQLSARWEAKVRAGDWQDKTPLPAIGGGVMVIIRPFQSRDQHLCLVFDQYLPVN
jgi:hypothetical protein